MAQLARKGTGARTSLVKKDVYERYLYDLKSRKFESIHKESDDEASTLGVLCSVLSCCKGGTVYMYNMSRAWADWHCLSYEWRQCESLRSGIGEEYRFPTSFPFLKQLLIAESRGFL